MSNTANTADPVATPLKESTFLPSRNQFLLLLFVYFAAHTIIRGLISEVAGIDDCDQIIRAQIWSWGYGPQPPLYTWLMKFFLGFFGHNIFSVTALKELALFGIYLFAYANTRLITRSHACAVAAAVALQFNPSISWESHRELTHSIITSLSVLATIFFLLRANSGKWSIYVLFGVSAACGTLSKYNYLIFFAALLIAALSIKETRPLVLNRKMLVALIIAAAICAPHVHWIYQHRDLAFSSVHKFKMDATQSWFAAMAKALPKWITDLLAHIGPMLAIFVLIFWRKVLKARVQSAEETLLWRTLVTILTVVTLSILLFKVTGFRDRWLQPLFVWLPILFIAALREHLTPLRLKWIVGLGAAIAVVVLIVAPGRLLLTEKLKKNEILNSPYRLLSRDLQPAVENADSIIASDYRIAGNLRLRFPDKFVTSPEFADLFPVVKGSSILAWDTASGTEPPPSLVRFAESITGKKPGTERTRAEEILKYHHTRTMQLQVVRMQ